ncbi:MAG: hypothetical protein JWP13_229 [Candidatus Saccharibacteria bacterium]|nr:hypothetical protein [Candidatus Saccharibacteria bacterium]
MPQEFPADQPQQDDSSTTHPSHQPIISNAFPRYGNGEQHPFQGGRPPIDDSGGRTPNHRPSMFIRVLFGAVSFVLLIGVLFVGAKSWSRMTTPISLEEKQQIAADNLQKMQNRDTEREVDLRSLSAQLEYFYDNHKYYPSLEQINDNDFRKKEFDNLDHGGPEPFRDPLGKTSKMKDSLGRAQYMYRTEPGSCDNTGTKCAHYVLGAFYEENPSNSNYFRLGSVN